MSTTGVFTHNTHILHTHLHANTYTHIPHTAHKSRLPSEKPERLRSLSSTTLSWEAGTSLQRWQDAWFRELGEEQNSGRAAELL